MPPHRHLAVVTTTHLNEALRRLRSNATDSSVDRRLITNILISFITTPRGDSKKFEMLSLLSSILNFTDEEKAQAGLSSQSSVSTKASHGLQQSSRGTTTPDLAQEGFASMFVEFLLKETSNQSTGPSNRHRSGESISVKSPTTPRHPGLTKTPSGGPEKPADTST